MTNEKEALGGRMFAYLLVMAMCAAAGLLGWRSLLNNYAVEVAGVHGAQMGLIQGLREVPGFLTLVVVYFLVLLSETRLAAASIILFGLGIGATGLFPSFSGLLATTLIMSVGFHFYASLGSSLALQYYPAKTAPIVMGRIRGYSAGASIGMAAFVFVLSRYLSYRVLYLIIGAGIVAAGAWCLAQNPVDKELAPQIKKPLIRKKYWLFYALTFLSGARRQIFVAFALFLMVERFGFSLAEISGLLIITSAVSYFTTPLVGRAIARFGERRLLSLEYSSLIVIFLVYAFTGNRYVAALVYVLDHVVFNIALAINTYFQKVAAPGDISASMATGFTINHLAAVALPIIGGGLWLLSYRITFIAGVALAVCSLALAQFIRTPDQGEEA